MKFYSGLLAIALTATSTMPSLASFESNLPQKIIVVAEQVNPPQSPVPEPEPVPHRGKGRR